MFREETPETYDNSILPAATTVYNIFKKSIYFVFAYNFFKYTMLQIKQFLFIILFSYYQKIFTMF